MTSRAIAHARLRNSRLVGESLAAAVDVVRWFGAVQSQDVPGAFWALSQRMTAGVTASDLGAAFDDGAITRTHALRPTWHFLAPSELRWVQALTGPRVHRANGTLYRTLGLRDDDFARAESAFRAALEGGRALTRAELRDVFGTLDLDLSNSLVITYLAMHAELEAVLCSGPRRGKQFTYQLVDERIPPTPARDRDDMLRDLVVRYFTSHGPATPHDASWWSGLTVSDVRRGIDLGRDALEEQTIDGTRYWAGANGFRPADVPASHVLLLSNYDEVLGSYADYSPVVDAAFSPPNWVYDAVGPHVILRDGLVAGGWRRELGARRVTVSATLFAAFSRPELDALEAQTEAFGRFFGLPAELRVTVT